MWQTKWGYVARNLTGHDRLTPGGPIASPKLGDLVVAQVVKLGEHEYLEDPHGRRARLYPRDLVVGAYGNRYATDFFEGYLPDAGQPTHLLTAGGLVGTVASAHSSKGAPTELAVIGSLTHPTGAAVNVADFALPAPVATHPAATTIVVLGSAMNAGKTTTVAAIVRGLTRGGMRVGAGKVTGSGSGKDHWAYQDAGAAAVVDFLDFGMASTFGYPAERLVATMFGIRDHLAAGGAPVVVLEIADGLLQSETRALVDRLPGFADRVVLAAGDALGAVAGTALLARAGVAVDAVSGLVSASPLATEEAAAATGLAVLSPDQLAQGRAFDLLGNHAAEPVPAIR